jgi:hypothetical protein
MYFKPSSIPENVSASPEMERFMERIVDMCIAGVLDVDRTLRAANRDIQLLDDTLIAARLSHGRARTDSERDAFQAIGDACQDAYTAINDQEQPTSKTKTAINERTVPMVVWAMLDRNGDVLVRGEPSSLMPTLGMYYHLTPGAPPLQVELMRVQERYSPPISMVVAQLRRLPGDALPPIKLMGDCGFFHFDVGWLEA